MVFSVASLVWLVLLVVFSVLEAATVALVSIWFAVGAAVDGTTLYVAAAVCAAV